MARGAGNSRRGPNTRSQVLDTGDVPLEEFSQDPSGERMEEHEEPREVASGEDDTHHEEEEVVTSLSKGCPNTMVSREDPGGDVPGLAKDKVK